MSAQLDTTVGKVEVGTLPVSSPKEAEIFAILAETKGAKIVSFTARTDARLKKTGNPYKGVVKVQRVNALVNFHYDAGVLRRLEKEGKSPDDFKKGTSWHVPVLGKDGELTPFCQHPKTGEYYLRICCLKRLEATYEDQDGVVLTREQIAEWLPAANGYENQGLDDPLVFLTFKLSGIEQLTVDGVTHHVVAA